MLAQWCAGVLQNELPLVDPLMRETTENFCCHRCVCTVTSYILLVIILAEDMQPCMHALPS